MNENCQKNGVCGNFRRPTLPIFLPSFASLAVIILPAKQPPGKKPKSNVQQSIDMLYTTIVKAKPQCTVYLKVRPENFTEVQVLLSGKVRLRSH